MKDQRPLGCFALLFGAALATTLLLSAGEVEGGDTPAMVSYGEGTSRTPRYRTWNGLDWAGERSASFVPGPAGVHWTVLAAHPSEAEAILGVLDVEGHLNVQVWDGDSWGAVLELTTAIGPANSAFRGFDIAYEQSSGEAVIVYQNDTNDPRYRVWNGSTWSGPATLDLPTSSVPVWIALRSNPSSDEIVVTAIDLGDYVTAGVWDGSSWGDTISLETNATTHDREHISIAYEYTSTRAMVIWGQAGFDTPQYRFWNGTSWEAEGSAPSIGGNPTWSRLASDPSSNAIAMAASDWGADLNVSIWDGSSWGTVVEFDTKVEATISRCFDVAFESSGNEAVVAWGHTNTHILIYATWSFGTGWSGPFIGPDMGNDIRLAQLKADPNSDELMLGTVTSDWSLKLTLWTGSAWEAFHEIETSISEQMYEPYMISYRSGAVTWTWIYPASGSIGGVASSPTIRGGRVYVGSDDSTLYCLDASDGTLIWTYSTGDRIRSSPAAAYESGNWVVYFGCDDGYLYAIRDMGITPQLKWSTQLQTPLVSSPALWDTLVFIGSGDSIQCRLAHDGSKLWAEYLGGTTYSSPAVFWDNKVWIGSNSDYIYKFSALDGTPEGSYQLCGDVVAPVWMSYLNGHVAIGSFASASPGADTMYVIENNFASAWKFSDGGSMARTYTSCFSLNDTTVYFGNDNDCQYGIDISGNPPALAYKYDTGDDVRSSPVWWGTVYFGSNNDAFYAVDEVTQEPLPTWPFFTNGDVQSSPAVSVSSGIVVVGSLDGHVYAFDVEP